MMPAYDFECSKCERVQEVTCSMEAISELKVPCPHCSDNVITVTEPVSVDKLHELPGFVFMHRLFGNAGTVFKGSGWPDKDRKRGTEDSNIQRQRRKACVLKDKGLVPEDHVLGLKESDKRFDAKFKDSDLDKLYQGPPRRKK